MRTIIFYTDVISALVRAMKPILDTLEDAKRRGDTEVGDTLGRTYDSLSKKLKRLIQAGAYDEGWRPSELNEGDAKLLTEILPDVQARVRVARMP